MSKYNFSGVKFVLFETRDSMEVDQHLQVSISQFTYVPFINDFNVECYKRTGLVFHY